MADSSSDRDTPKRSGERARYQPPVLREYGSLTELTRVASTVTSKPLDNTTRTKTNRSF